MALTTLKQSRRGSVLRSFGELDKAAPRFAHTLVPISRGNPFMHRKQAKRRAPEPMSQALFQLADSASLRRPMESRLPRRLPTEKIGFGPKATNHRIEW